MMNPGRLTWRMLVRAIAIASVLLTAVGAGGALAAPAPSLTATLATATPEQGIPTTFTFAGQAPGGADSVIDAVARPAAGGACASTFEADRAAVATSTVVANALPVSNGAAFSVPQGWTPATNGSTIICAWLEQAGATGSAAATATATVNVAAPQVSAFSIAIPGVPTAGQLFGVYVTTQTDQQLSLDAVIHPSTSPGCGASYEADRAALPTAPRVFGNTPVAGGPIVSSDGLKLGRGSYVMCAWLEGPLAGQVDASTAAPLNVAAAPHVTKTTKAARSQPTLNITTARASLQSGIALAGTTASAFAGEVLITAKCGKDSTKGSASASGGHFATRLTLPAGCTAGDKLTVKITTNQTTTFNKGSANASAIVTSNQPVTSGQSTNPRVRTLFTKAKGKRGAYTNLFRTRPTSILIASSVHLTLSITRWTRWTTGGAGGSGTVAPRSGHRYPVTVTAGHDIRGTFACLTLTHTVHRRRHVLHFGLGRAGGHLLWVPLSRLHSRSARSTPWPLRGCPAVRRTGGPAQS
jgi:hypothetical protein